jgi:hypothetical protein
MAVVGWMVETYCNEGVIGLFGAGSLLCSMKTAANPSLRDRSCPPFEGLIALWAAFVSMENGDFLEQTAEVEELLSIELVDCTEEGSGDFVMMNVAIRNRTHWRVSILPCDEKKKKKKKKKNGSIPRQRYPYFE